MFFTYKISLKLFNVFYNKFYNHFDFCSRVNCLPKLSVLLFCRSRLRPIWKNKNTLVAYKTKLCASLVKNSFIEYYVAKIDGKFQFKNKTK